MVKTITSREEFDQAVKSGKVVLDFYGTFCGPCKRLSPELDLLAQSRSDLKVIKVDVEELPDVATEYHVRSIPAIFFIDEGKVVKNIVGYRTKEQLESELK